MKLIGKFVTNLNLYRVYEYKGSDTLRFFCEDYLHGCVKDEEGDEQYYIDLQRSNIAEVKVGESITGRDSRGIKRDMGIVKTIDREDNEQSSTSES